MKKFDFTTVEPNLRLDVFLASQERDLSRGQWQQAIKAGQVRVAGEIVTKPAFVLDSDVSVSGVLPDEGQSLQADLSVQFDVVAEEKDFLIINKPVGLVVHPGSGNLDKTLVNGLIARYPGITGVGEDKIRPGIAHRLDKETSGVMIIAKTELAFQYFKQAFKDRQIEKFYLAVLSGNLAKQKGVITGQIRRSEHNPIKRELTSQDGKNSRTEYRVLQPGKDWTLVEARPQTGRTHQLRVHFASLGHPILGDTLYGHRVQTDSLMLHAHKIKFQDPSGVWREYVVDPPEKFKSYVTNHN